MEFLAQLTLPAIELLTLAFFALAALQAVHVFATGMRHTYSPDLLVMAYEVMLVVHLLLSCALVYSLAFSPDAFTVDFLQFDLPISTLLWFNLLASIVGGITCYRNEVALMMPEVVLLFFLTPPLAILWGPLWPYLVVLDAMYFIGRMVVLLSDDHLRGFNTPSRTSISEALDKLPEGVLYIGEGGRAVFMNDTMRNCLGALGLPLDLADMRTLWPELNRICSSGLTTSGVLPAGLRIELPGGEVRLFTLGTAEMRGHSYECLIAYDITEEDRLRREIAAANAQLERTSAELEASLGNIESIADNEAVLSMRSHVHDVIGQRLSILHRYLEDDHISDETIAKIKPLLTSMLSELESESGEGQVATLDDIIRAFGVIGVEYHVSGQMPVEPALQLLFARIVREASTNAVRHAGASSIAVEMHRTRHKAMLLVRNDGLVPEGAIVEGSGIRGMRNAVAELHGTLTVQSTPAFTIWVEVPMDEGERP